MIYQDMFPLRGLFYNLHLAETMTKDPRSLPSRLRHHIPFLPCQAVRVF